MPTTIEVTASAIRLVVTEANKLILLEQWPVPVGADPLAALAAAPLLDNLGKVGVLLHHDDLLIRSLVQPACPPERLDRVLRFEMAGMQMDDEALPSSLAWHLSPVSAPDGDLRVLTQITRTRLVDRLREIISARGGKLERVTHPAVGLAHAFRQQVPGHQGTDVLVDVGGRHLHVAVVRDGQLVFLRTHTPCMDELAKSVAGKRSLAEADASSLVRKLGPGSPEDLKDLIAQQAGSIAAAITANLRFCKTTFKLSELQPERVYVSGAGALAHGFITVLATRIGMPVRLLNPFAGQLTQMPAEQLDRLAALPGPWAPVIGAAMAPQWELDALSDERGAKQRYWRSEGALKAAAIAATLLSAIGVVAVESAKARTHAKLAELEEVVPKAQELARQIATAREQHDNDAARLRWLDAERRPGRIAPELLSAIGRIQDPATCPVVLASFQLTRQPGGTGVELTGAATSAKVSPEQALKSFADGLRNRYPAIASLDQLPTSIDANRLMFRYRLAIPDGL